MNHSRIGCTTDPMTGHDLVDPHNNPSSPKMTKFAARYLKQVLFGENTIPGKTGRDREAQKAA